tara:strand:- start:35482 stop:36540 length:1059 start_codon:yes stop_codon:yes gene_type:complete
LLNNFGAFADLGRADCELWEENIMNRPISRRFLLAAAAALAAVGLAPFQASAQNYPSKPVELVLAFGTGGVSDIIARTLAPALEEKLGQRFIVQNMPGAGGTVAMQAVSKAGPDGYTLLNVGTSGPIKRTLMPNLPFDQVEDFEPVTPISNFGLVIVSAPDSQFSTLEYLVNYARENPGMVNIGTVSVGSTQYLAAKLFATVAGVDAAVIPYKSSPELMGGVARGEVDVAFEIIAGAKSAIENAQVVPLATTMAGRSKLYPDTPTVEEAGITPYDVSSWNGYSAPNGVPEEVKTAINDAMRELLADPVIAEKLAAIGAETWIATPQEMRTRQEQETEMWAKVIEDAGVPIEK